MGESGLNVLRGGLPGVGTEAVTKCSHTLSTEVVNQHNASTMDSVIKEIYDVTAHPFSLMRISCADLSTFMSV